MEFYQQIAADMQTTLDDELIMAIEGACITQAEYQANAFECRQRIRGALEETSEEFN